MRGQDRALGGHKKVHILHRIQEQFIPYLMPSFLHPICPMIWLVMAVCSSLVADFTPFWVMKVFRVPESVIWGYLAKV